MQTKEIPVYLFTGFLESGKTKFIQETLEDPRFQDGEKTLLIVCEEGLTEYEPEKFDRKVKIAYIDDEEDLSEDRLKSLVAIHNAERVLIEYNGMWQMGSLFMAFPGDWTIYQEMCFMNAETFIMYNTNMRQQTFEKLQTADTVVFNRCPDDVDKETFHKIVRGANYKNDILYEYKDGSVEADDIEDPLPYDMDAPIVEIGDDYFAYWYRDMMDDSSKYDGKTMRFKAAIANSTRLPAGVFVVGRPLMTCCEADIRNVGLACETNGPKPTFRKWAVFTAKVKIKKSPAYGNAPGPVFIITDMEYCDAPDNPVATF